MRLAPVSESYLRELLRSTGLPFDQPWAGIRQHTLRGVGGIAARDAGGVPRGDGGGRPGARALLPPAGDRGQGSGEVPGRQPRTTPEKREKEEMVQWMLVWLENPEVFPAWVEARKKQIGPRMDVNERE